MQANYIGLHSAGKDQPPRHLSPSKSVEAEYVSVDRLMLLCYNRSRGDNVTASFVTIPNLVFITVFRESWARS